jgi:hypothetical protein
MSKHTPGPWRIQGAVTITGKPGGIPRFLVWPAEETETSVVEICEIDCQIEGNYTCNIAEAKANARLIAAAPELLAACKFLLAAAETEPGMAIYVAHIQQARAAIAKAERGE